MRHCMARAAGSGEVSNKILYWSPWAKAVFYFEASSKYISDWPGTYYVVHAGFGPIHGCGSDTGSGQITNGQLPQRSDSPSLSQLSAANSSIARGGVLWAPPPPVMDFKLLMLCRFPADNYSFYSFMYTAAMSCPEGGLSQHSFSPMLCPLFPGPWWGRGLCRCST